MNLETDDPLAVSVVKAIQKGDLEALQKLLESNPSLAKARLSSSKDGKGMCRTLLHIATDWPGNYPHVADTVVLLVAAGADANARFTGSHTETPLHWAASSDDVAAVDALLDSGADIEATGAVIANGTPLADAVGFGQWKAARRLVERGARTTLSESAALGLIDRVREYFSRNPPPSQDQINRAFWYACHGGSCSMAEYLGERGADVNWLPPWERKTPLDAAQGSQAAEVVNWLRGRNGKSAQEL